MSGDGGSSPSVFKDKRANITKTACCFGIHILKCPVTDLTVTRKYLMPFLMVLSSISGPVSSVLVNTYGSRPVMIMGGFLCSISMIAASFCNSVIQLYICIGVIGGEWIKITYGNNYAKNTFEYFLYYFHHDMLTAIIITVVRPDNNSV